MANSDFQSTPPPGHIPSNYKRLMDDTVLAESIQASYM